MSAALAIWAGQANLQEWETIHTVPLPKPQPQPAPGPSGYSGNLAFYRRHTERTLRRFMYASILVGRAPSMLSEPLSRAYVSSRPVKTFEDAVIFVLDIERCLDRLNVVDRRILERMVIQEYTQSETASLLGMSVRAINRRFPEALDRLTRILLDADLLVLPR